MLTMHAILHQKVINEHSEEDEEDSSSSSSSGSNINRDKIRDKESRITPLGSKIAASVASAISEEEEVLGKEYSQEGKEIELHICNAEKHIYCLENSNVILESKNYKKN